MMAVAVLTMVSYGVGFALITAGVVLGQVTLIQASMPPMLVALLATSWMHRRLSK